MVSLAVLGYILGKPKAGELNVALPVLGEDSGQLAKL